VQSEHDDLKWKQQEESSFLKKRSKELLSIWRVAGTLGPVTEPNVQKLFASFSKKKTFLRFLIPTDVFSL